jgi:hypothetical protein
VIFETKCVPNQRIDNVALETEPISKNCENSKFMSETRDLRTMNERIHFDNILILNFGMIHRGARYLTGENLEVVWAEFSTLSCAVLFQINLNAWHTHSHF